MPTTTFIPSELALPGLDRSISATSANPSYAANKIDIAVVPGTPDSAIETLAMAENGTFLGRESRIGLYQLRFPFPVSSAGLDLAERIRTAYNFVQFATPSLLFDPLLIPTDPSWSYDVPDTQSWAQINIHLPEAWDFGTVNSKARIAIIDLEFLPHEDLNPVRVESKLAGSEPEHGLAVASKAAATGDGDNPVGLARVMWSSHLVELAASGIDDIAVQGMLVCCPANTFA